MSTETQVQRQEEVAAGVSRSEPVGRAQRNARGRDAGGVPPRVADLPDRVKALLPDEVLDELLAGAQGEREIVGPGGLLSQLTKRLVERAMEVELTDHLGYEPHAEPPGAAGNARNGTTPKTRITEQGAVRIDAPRDRAGTFEPQIVPKRQRRFEGLTRRSSPCTPAACQRGMSKRTSPRFTTPGPGRADRAMTSTLVFLDALVLKIRDGGTVQRRACYLALAINMDGEREVLGMWFQANEGAKFWMQVLTDLKHRGVQDILIACVDGLRGFPEAIEATFPLTTVQTCTVHLIRHSLKYVPRRQYEQVSRDLRPIYTAIDADAALVALKAFEEKWGKQLPVIGQA
jgi:putative transposase